MQELANLSAHIKAFINELNQTELDDHIRVRSGAIDVLKSEMCGIFTP